MLKAGHERRPRRLRGRADHVTKAQLIARYNTLLGKHERLQARYDTLDQRHSGLETAYRMERELAAKRAGRLERTIMEMDYWRQAALARGA